MFLAKRFYDLASEMSSEAKVPVSLAMCKLFFMMAMEYITGVNIKIIAYLDTSLKSNYNLYHLLEYVTGEVINLIEMWYPSNDLSAILNYTKDVIDVEPL